MAAAAAADDGGGELRNGDGANELLPPSSFGDSNGPTTAALEAEKLKATQRQEKVVHFVRHGEGYHNIGYDRRLDAHLTERGWADATALQQHIATLREMGTPMPLEAVIVSPLTRTMETAAAAFGTDFPMHDSGGMLGGMLGRANGSSGGGGGDEAGGKAGGGEDVARQPQLLMRAQSRIRGQRVEHTDIAAPDGLPFVAQEDCRERMSVNRCDSRRPVRMLRQDFPGVDFSAIPHDEDKLWNERHAQVVSEGERGSRFHVSEKAPAVIERGNRFMAWLLQRPESHLAVVSHREMLHHMLSTVGADADPDLRRELSRGFNNCEMRSVVFNAQGVPVRVQQDTYYPGGMARLYLFPLNWTLQKGRRLLKGLGV